MGCWITARTGGLVSFEAEQAVLGSMMLDNECIPIVCEILFSDMFQDGMHRIAFSGIVKLHDEGIPVDLVQVKNLGLPVPLVRSIAESVPHAASAEYYAKIVRSTYKVVQLKKLSGDIKSIASESIDPDEMIAKVQKSVTDHTEHQDLKETDHVADIGNTLSFTRGGSRRIPTGFNAIDDIIIGICKTDYVIIAGRPSMGKTALLLDIAVNMSWDNGFQVAFYSCEMSKEQLVSRMASARCGVPLFRVEKGYAKPEEIELLQEAVRQMKDCPMYMKSTGGLTPSALRRMISSDKRKHNIKAAFVDYLQLMQPDGKSRSQYEDITQISRSIKPIIVQTGVPIIMASQLKRIEHAQKPTMTDFRGSGAIEEDTDIIIGLHRDSYYDAEAKDAKDLAMVLKGRHFGPGVAELLFEGNLTHFKDKPWMSIK